MQRADLCGDLVHAFLKAARTGIPLDDCDSDGVKPYLGGVANHCVVGNCHHMAAPIDGTPGHFKSEPRTAALANNLVSR
jgi:hypothetical protein